MTLLGLDRFLIGGDPPALLDGVGLRLTALAGAPAAARGVEATVTTSARDGATVAVLAGPAGVAIYDVAGDRFAEVAAAGAPGLRRAHAAVRLPGGDVLAVGGQDAATGTALGTALRITPAGVVTMAPLLARARAWPAVAAGGGVLVVAGGFDDAGAALDDAELFAVDTLAPLGATPLVRARGQASATTLGNGTVLLAGGRAAAGGAPVGTVEIFTP